MKSSKMSNEQLEQSNDSLNPFDDEARLIATIRAAKVYLETKAPELDNLMNLQSDHISMVLVAQSVQAMLSSTAGPAVTRQQLTPAQN